MSITPETTLHFGEYPLTFEVLESMFDSTYLPAVKAALEECRALAKFRDQATSNLRAKDVQIEQLSAENAALQANSQAQSVRISELTRRLADAERRKQRLQAELNARPEADADEINRRLQMLERFITQTQEPARETSSILETTEVDDSAE